MADNELETRVENVEAMTEKIKASLQHSTDMLEINNLQSYYCQLIGISFGRIDDDYFAHNTPGVTSEIVEAGAREKVFGTEQTDKNSDGEELAPMFPVGGFEDPGILGLNPVGVGYVTISKDGKTAKGMWDQFDPHSMVVTPYPGDERKMTQYWFLGRYNNSFVKENGKWKCLTQQVLAYFRTPFKEGWLRQPDCRHMDTTGKATFEALWSRYHSDGVFYAIPAPPEPLD